MFLVYVCGSSTASRPEESRSYFDALAGDLGFEVVEQAIRPHGQALDDIFLTEVSELTLLLDSDAELLNPDLVPRYIAHFRNEQVFGAGFVHGPGWLSKAQGHPEHVGYYQERAWLPFAMFQDGNDSRSSTRRP